MINKINYISFIILQIIFGFLLADFITAIFHWFEDTYLDYDCKLPFFSDIAKHNEMHHYFPRSIIAYSIYENIDTTIPFAIILVVIIYVFFRKQLFMYPFFFGSFILFSVFSNVFHKFSHMRDCELPIVVKYLQRIGIICSHKEHSIHHSKNNNQKYCVMSGYLNYILDNLGFWRGLEWLVKKITGKSPKRKGKYDDYKEIHNYMHENNKKECPKIPTKEDIDILIKKLDHFIKTNPDFAIKYLESFSQRHDTNF